ncbi:UNVERIFIED_CONTAM: hypothetical protein GTU68_024410, partial [Idotea baltica]|nr:hypothetical protein [Idotea baltica]
MKVVLPLTYLQ